MTPSGILTWTAAEDATLRSGYLLGFTTTDIAERLGKTKNAIVGRARRLGLSNPEANPVKRKAPEPLFQNPETTGCRYPLWGDEPPTQQFCGAARHSGDAYCAEHRKRCYGGAPVLKAREYAENYIARRKA